MAFFDKKQGGGDPNNFRHSTRTVGNIAKVLGLGAAIGAGVAGAWCGAKDLFFKPVKPMGKENNNFKPKRR